jgi:L-lactate dehydrogenase
VGCVACVIADRAGQPSSEWQGDDGLGLLGRLLPYVERTPLVFAGAAQAGLMMAASRERHVDRARLIGTSTQAYASAMRSMVAIEAGSSAQAVSLAVLGTPPTGLVVPWSEASIDGLTLERVLSQVQLTRLDARAPSLWPPGPYALGMAAAQAVEAIVCSSRRAMSLLTVLDGEYGVRSRVGALPVRLHSEGIAHRYVPTLSTRERVQLETALAGQVG